MDRQFLTAWNGRARRLPRRPRPLVIEDLESRTLLSFSPAHMYTTGKAPFGVATADLRLIGVLDLVVVNTDANTVSVFLGNGNGTFGIRQNYAVGRQPESVSVGDINFDGIPDLLVANAGGNTVSILYGNGDGTFQAAVTMPIGNRAPEAIAAADFRGYGGLFDFVTANNGSDSVSVFTNNFDGTATQTDYALNPGALPVSVAVGDLFTDGVTSIVTANNGTNTVSVLYGIGDGTFASPIDFPVGASPEAVGLGDLRGYGVLDIVTANYESGTVSVLFNNEDGTFGPAQTYSIGRFPNSLAVADLNGDNFPDLIATNFLDHTITVLLNNGDGTFGAPITFNVGSVPSALAVGDYNADGFNDLAVANTNSNNLSVLLNDGNWSAGGSPGQAPGRSPHASAAGEPFAGVAIELNHLLSDAHVSSIDAAALLSWNVGESDQAATSRTIFPPAEATTTSASDSASVTGNLRPTWNRSRPPEVASLGLEREDDWQNGIGLSAIR